jgi:hypothetical protein
VRGGGPNVDKFMASSICQPALLWMGTLPKPELKD